MLMLCFLFSRHQERAGPPKRGVRKESSVLRPGVGAAVSVWCVGAFLSFLNGQEAPAALVAPVCGP